MRLSPGRAARRCGKTVYVGYYRWLYGRAFPGADRAQAAVERLEGRLGHGDTPAEQRVWEEKVADGRWDYMRELHESPRYATVATMVNALGGSEASIFDVGCGEGLLVDHLRRFGYRDYLGLDIAEQAILDAAGRRDEHTDFVAADAETFTPGEGRTFDVIVLNECLCYFRDPLATVDRFAGLLAPGGSLVASTFRTPRHDAIARLVAGRYDVVEEITVGNRLGTSLVRVLKPPR